VAYYRRRLPHIYEIAQPVFLTWCLRDSLPPDRAFAEDSLTAGEAFAAMDRLLEQARCGPHYLSQPVIAEIVVEAIHYNSTTLRHYQLHAFVIMPNHIHLLITPTIALPKLTRSLKRITAKRANQLLDLTGAPFWQVESYDRLVRDAAEFQRIRRYIEHNPVRAGLVMQATHFPWSSAGWPARGPAANQGVHPTNSL
jgi:REP element-mobilizing transposase RayT